MSKDRGGTSVLPFLGMLMGAFFPFGRGDGLIFVCRRDWVLFLL